MPRHPAAVRSPNRFHHPRSERYASRVVSGRPTSQSRSSSASFDAPESPEERELTRVDLCSTICVVLLELGFERFDRRPTFVLFRFTRALFSTVRARRV
jgi:hypothetical protein